jgi:hypothetical protein
LRDHPDPWTRRDCRNQLNNRNQTSHRRQTNHRHPTNQLKQTNHFSQINQALSAQKLCHQKLPRKSLIPQHLTCKSFKFKDRRYQRRQVIDSANTGFFF